MQIWPGIFQNYCFAQFLDSFQAFIHGKFQSHKFFPCWIFHVIGLTKIPVAPSIVFCTKAMWAVLILFGFSLSIVFFLCCNFVVLWLWFLRLRASSPTRLSCKISFNQCEAEMSANVNKQWKTCESMNQGYWQYN